MYNCLPNTQQHTEALNWFYWLFSKSRDGSVKHLLVDNTFRCCRLWLTSRYLAVASSVRYVERFFQQSMASSDMWCVTMETINTSVVFARKALVVRRQCWNTWQFTLILITFCALVLLVEKLSDITGRCDYMNKRRMGCTKV